MRWRKVSLIGVGLLGGSLGLALKQRALAAHVSGYVRRSSTGEEALARGAVDSATTSLHDCVADADLVVLCTPLAQMQTLASSMGEHLAPDALITDVGSVKGSLARDLQPIFARSGHQFIGSHPMAGSEKMGVSAARGDLFVNAMCVVTPSEASPEPAIRKIEDLWSSLGAKTMRLAPDTHDEWVSRSSHLPHVVASVLARFVLNPKFPPQQAKLCANGFKDSTRIAASSPEMWRDIILANREQVTQALRDYSAELHHFAQLIESENSSAILDLLAESKKLRDGWTLQSQSSSQE